jgi:hypothetical protein
MKGLLAILGRPEDAEGEDDPFETAFMAFRSALKTGDAMKAKKAFRLMKESCEEEYSHDSEHEEEDE